MKYAIFLLLLLLLPVPIQAQENALWPPDPMEIFAPGVEVVSVEIKEPHLYNLPTIDNEKRVVRVFVELADEWREYPFPDEIKQFDPRISSYSENTLLLSTTLGGEYSSIPLPEGQWLLNTDTGDYSRPELACGQLRAKPGLGRWVINAEDQGKTFFLCNTESEEQVGPIPLEQNDYLQAANISPDGKHAIIFAHLGNVYSYTFDTNGLIVLGSTCGWEIQQADWIDDTRVFITSTNRADMSFPWRCYYLADATQPDSLEGVSTVFKPFNITSFDNPRRYQWVSYKDQKCYLTELNWETGQITDYDLDDLCSEGRIIPDDSEDRLYFEFTWPTDAFSGMGYPIKQPTSSALVRYNPFTGNRINLLNGEIEWIEAISPDGLYAVVTIDDNDCFEADPREDPLMNLPPCESNKASEPRHVVIDIKTGDMLYEQTTQWIYSGDGHHGYFCFDEESKSVQDYCTSTLTAGPVDSLIPIGNQLLIYVRRIDGEVEYSLIDLHDKTPRKRVFEQVDGVRYLPKSQQFLLTLGSSFTEYAISSAGVELYDIATEAKWDLYDLATNTRFPFIQDMARNQYVILFGESTADSMLVTVFPPGGWKNGQLDSVERYIYTVRFPKSHD